MNDGHTVGVQRDDPSKSRPKWATEPVEVVPYDPGWPRRAQEEVARLTHLLTPWLSKGIHHIGSTAVPGLPAKPIIDLMAGIDDLDAAEQARGALEPEGWHFVPPDLDDRSWRRFFVKVEDEARRVHLHLVRPNDPRWSEHLQFRDRLREDSQLAMEYAQLKRTLATEHSADREAYTRAKALFIRSATGSAS